MAVYDVPPKAECRGGVTRPVNRYDRRRFAKGEMSVYRGSLRRFNGVNYSFMPPMVIPEIIKRDIKA